MPNSALRTFAVASGKGGVGKTNLSVNLSVALSMLEQSVLLMDADLGLANVDVLLGLKPKYNLSHVLSGEVELADILLTGPADIRVIPAASGTQNMAELSRSELGGIVQAFSSLPVPVNALIVDAAAGIAGSVVQFARATQFLLVVVCDEPTSITDAYALIKVLSRDYGLSHFQIISNMVPDEIDGQKLFYKLLSVTDQFLDVTLSYLGSVPYDDCVRTAVKGQRAFAERYPNARATRACIQIAKKMLTLPLPDTGQAGMQFFFERLITKA